jgi:hypothetical protein
MRFFVWLATVITITLSLAALGEVSFWYPPWVSWSAMIEWVVIALVVGVGGFFQLFCRRMKETTHVALVRILSASTAALVCQVLLSAIYYGATPNLSLPVVAVMGSIGSLAPASVFLLFVWFINIVSAFWCCKKNPDAASTEETGPSADHETLNQLEIVSE